MVANQLTRPDHTATALRVRVQKRNFRGLGVRATACSEGTLGSPGVVASFLAEVVGKYIRVGCSKNRIPPSEFDMSES